MFVVDSPSEDQRPTLLFTNNESRSENLPPTGGYTKDGINQYVVHGMSCLFCQIVHKGRCQPVRGTRYVLSVLSDCTQRTVSTSTWYTVCLVCSVRLYTKDGINQYIVCGTCMTCLFCHIIRQGRHQPVHSTWYVLSVLSDRLFTVLVEGMSSDRMWMTLDT